MIVFTNHIMAIEISADLFTYDAAKIEKEFSALTALEVFIKSNPEKTETDIILAFPSLKSDISTQINLPFNQLDIEAPGKIPSFWFTFTLSAIGTYFIYGAVAGPISVGIVYLSANKDKSEVKKAIWGCLTGTLVGAGIKYAVVKLI
jgi:hypothetical protein